MKSGVSRIENKKITILVWLMWLELYLILIFLKDKGSELYENIVRLELRVQDGRLRETDILDTKGVLRLIKSVPSPKAQPFKLWFASIGSGIDEVFDSEIAIY